MLEDEKLKKWKFPLPDSSWLLSTAATAALISILAPDLLLVQTAFSI